MFGDSMPGIVSIRVELSTTLTGLASLITPLEGRESQLTTRWLVPGGAVQTPELLTYRRRIRLILRVFSDL
jgi:hypothetical protein